MEESIHGLPQYTSFHYYFTFSTILAIIPFTYIIPTVFIMLKIVNSYFSTRNWQSNFVSMNQHIFIVIIFYFIFNILFFLSDYLRLTLPSTGLFTNWCANIEPNHFFKLIFLSTFYFNYGSILLPSLLCLIRLIILIYPRSHPLICTRILLISIPMLFIIPLCCTFFMIPALGYCRQMGEPLKFGAIYLYYTGEWFGMRNSYIHLTFSVVFCSLTILLSLLMVYKLRQSAVQNSSARTKQLSQRAETSLSITVFSSIVPFINNTILTIVYLTMPQYVYYLMILRPFGNDCETVMMPWILYFTHPMFRHKKKTFNHTPSTISAVSPKSSHPLS